MQIKNTSLRYGNIAIYLHWILAVIIIGMLILGLYMTTLPDTVNKFKLYRWHKEWGVVVLMLAVIRLIWRANNVAPLLQLPWWEKMAAHGAHYALYFFMFSMPLTGWLMSSAAGFSVSFFGIFILPDLVPNSEPLRKLFGMAHEWLGYGLIATIIGHAGAAFQHHFIYKDDILRRMLPWK